MRWELRTRRGEAVPNASTSDATAERVRQDRQRGMKYRELAEKHHISESTVQRILTGGAYHS